MLAHAACGQWENALASCKADAPLIASRLCSRWTLRLLPAPGHECSAVRRLKGVGLCEDAIFKWPCVDFVAVTSSCCDGEGGWGGGGVGQGTHCLYQPSA